MLGEVIALFAWLFVDDVEGEGLWRLEQ